ncbi:MAG: alkaline phosphatase D family protein, partial [Pseudomonadota bacterium]
MPVLYRLLVVTLFFTCEPVAASVLNTLAFGSCNHSHLPQPLWSVVEQHNPDVFLWVGDVIYADTQDVRVMQRKYRQQLSNQDYLRLRDKVDVIGLWDDHDFGDNNAGKNNPIKGPSQQLFLDFLQEPADSPRRQQRGIYTSHLYGSAEQQVKVILLDTRFHRDLPGSGRADILGDAQWRWLEQELADSTARVNIIASGVSVLSPQIPFAEEWNDFKWARKRLFNLINKHQPGGVLFLVGDRHFSSHLSSREAGGVFHEFMSSGLTHYMNRPWVSAIFKMIYGEANSYFGRNFSKLEFIWEAPVRVVFSVHDVENQQRVRKELRLVDGRWRE